MILGGVTLFKEAICPRNRKPVRHWRASGKLRLGLFNEQRYLLEPCLLGIFARNAAATKIILFEGGA